MSRLDKLSIQGIRSFSPNGPEVIAFYPPITLILGKNGSGKTTIIESLKYATTGDMPAGTNRGQSFIHDPKLTRSGTSRAVVKLQYYDEKGKLYCISRTMEGTKQGSDVKVRSMDATVSLVQPDGKMQSLKNKIADLNNFITNTLGVSKAILNNVIFCHQEDSNWPLDEAKKVKEKFDDIFNTTRYVKCQEQIRQRIKGVSDGNRSALKLLEFYKKDKEEAEELRSEYQKLLQRKQDLEIQIDQLEQSKAPLESSMEQLRKKIEQAQELAEELRRAKDRLEELERQKDYLQSTITRVVRSDPEGLQREIEQFEHTKRQRQIELGQSEEKSAAIDVEIRKYTSTQQEKLLELGKLQSEEKQHLAYVASRDKLLRAAAEQYSWPDRSSFSGEPLRDELVSELGQFLDRRLNDAKTAELDLKKRLDTEDKQRLEELSKLRDDCVRKEADITAKENNLSSLQEELGVVTTKLDDMDSYARQVIELESHIAAAEKRLENAANEVDMTLLQNEIDELKLDYSKRVAELDLMKEKRKRLQKQHELRLELERTQRDLSGKKQQERRILSRPNVEEAIRVLIPEHQKENLLQHYKAKLESLAKDIAQQEAELKELGNQIASVEMDMKHTKSSLDNRKKELTDTESKLKAAGIRTAGQLDMDLKKLGEEMEKLEDERGIFVGSQKLYAHFIDKMQLERESAACPLCNREFSALQESLDLIDEMRDRIARMPAKIEDYEKKLNDKKSRQSQLLQLRPAAESAAKLASDDIPKLQQRLEELESKLESLKTKQENLEESSQFVRCEEDIGKKAQSDIVVLDSTQSDIKKLQLQVETQQKQLGLSGEQSESLTEFEARLEEEDLAFRNMAKQLGEKQELFSKQQSKLAGLKEECNKSTEKKLQLTTHLQERESLKKRKHELEQTIEDTRTAAERLRDLLTPAIAKRMHAESMYETAKRNKELQLDESRKKVEALASRKRDLSILEGHIARWNTEGKAVQLEREAKNLEDVKEKLKNLETDKKAIQRQLENLKLALNNCEIEERNLKDNLKLLSTELDKKALELKSQKLRQDYAAIDVNRQKVEWQKCTDGITSANNKISEMRGSYKVLQEQVKSTEAQVKSPKYAKAEDVYQEKFYDYESHVAVAEDLNNFYGALNWALMEFHRERMNVINTLVREMWHNTYRGKDIEYIEVKAEEPEVSTSAEKRRQYNYRVVMVKNGVEMDMRGRCSAGQKVLASLIIRMALAEAFSSKCGVLALDEPTTNLDEENITSLCDTILQLAETISQTRRHFQLLVISHDERFLERMSRTARLEKFFRVERNRENQSQILEHDVRDGSRIKLK